MAPSSGKCHLDLVALMSFFLFSLQIGKGMSFSMLSRGQLYVKNAGEQIDLNCEFFSRYFNLFDNPVLWIKTQYHEHSRVNIMSNINVPFMNTTRFQVTFTPTAPRFKMELSIRHVSLEDSGNYTCEVRGPETSVLGTVTHKLFIRAAVQDLVLSRTNCTDTCEETRTPASLSFIENEPSFLQCTAFGGNPPPNIRLFIGDFDITYRFRSHTHTELQGHHGLRIMHSIVHTRTSYMEMRAEDDGKQLRCESSIGGLPANTTSTLIHVHFAPVITCSNSTASIGERNAHVTCMVRSRPTVGTLLWIIDDNGTVVSQGKMKGEHWTLVMDETPGEWSTDLYVKIARPQYFKSYIIVAENIVGKTQTRVSLLKREKTMEDDTSPNHKQSPEENRESFRDTFIYLSDAQRHLARPPLVCLLLLLAFRFILDDALS